VLGLKSLDELEQRVVPKAIRGNGEELNNLPQEPLSEADALNEITELAKMNRVLKSFIGMGYVSLQSP
jgi:glycine dehydrogenase